MLESLRIRNYRVFKDLKVDGLHRINLIAGKNNSGKTSLLEAIFLLAGAGNPQLAVNAYVLRITEESVQATPVAFESAWKEIFHSLDTNSPIVIEGCHSHYGLLKLEMSLERWHGDETRLPGSFDRTSLSEIIGASSRSLTLRYHDSFNNESIGQVRLTRNRLDVIQPETSILLNSRIILPKLEDIHEEAVLLGKLRTQKRSDVLLNALNIIEPNLQSVEDSAASGVPMIWGDIGLSELIPLPMMGEGMTHLARIVLSISSVPGGMVLIDEVENGLHHSVQAKVWKAIASAAEQFDVQVFATTHSFECIETAAQGLGVEGFRLARISNRDGANQWVKYKPDGVELVIRRGLEVR